MYSWIQYKTIITQRNIKHLVTLEWTNIQVTTRVKELLMPCRHGVFPGLWGGQLLVKNIFIPASNAPHYLLAGVPDVRSYNSGLCDWPLSDYCECDSLSASVWVQLSECVCLSFTKCLQFVNFNGVYYFSAVGLFFYECNCSGNIRTSRA